MRTGGAEALAFDVACLSGPEAALPHGAPGDRPMLDGSVLLFDFGAQVEGYRSDMTRTLFVSEPSARDQAVYELVARAQSSAIGAVEAAVRGGGELPSGRAVDAVARRSSRTPGTAISSVTAPGTGSAWRPTRPRRSARARPNSRSRARRSSPSSPGSISMGEMGVRIEDLIAVDAAAGRVERLTRFPSEVLVVG